MINIGDSVFLVDEPGSPAGCVLAIERSARHSQIFEMTLLLHRPFLRQRYAIVGCDGLVSYHTRH